MHNIVDFFRQGGFVMWPLIICLVITIGIILERCVTFRKMVASDPESLIEEVRDKWTQSKQDASAVLAHLEAVDSPFGRVFARGLKNADKSPDMIDLAMSQEAGAEIPVLESYLTGLKTIVGIAPLMGLLGTIAGMIYSFKEVAAHGLASPTAVMKGVSESLISTATGIAIAILALIFYNYFASLVKKFVEDLEYYGAELTNTITGRIA
jgi:biopolymer transport protein ExbB